MPVSWTAAQEAAMNIRNKTMLVSAAAGSGKTATLTERIIRSITDKTSPSDISKMLIVTYTRAAAAELRSRIFSAISDALAKTPNDRWLTSQLIKLGSAKISTIDSFYLELIRSNFTKLGISPSFRVGDSAELDILATEIMNDSIELLYEKNTDFPEFCECFTNPKGSSNLADIFIKVREDLVYFPEGIDFLKHNAERTEKEACSDFFSTSYGKALWEKFYYEAEYYKMISDAAIDYIERDEDINAKYGTAFAYQKEFCDSLLHSIDKLGYTQTKALLDTFSPPSLKALPKALVTDEVVFYKEKRTLINKRIRDMKDNFFSRTPESITDAMLLTSKNISVMYSLLSEFELRFSEEKRKRNVMDFNDIKRYTMKLLVDETGNATETAREIAQQFSEIYIDEYQDVDRVQDLIFSSISNNNRFMVGDIKQSIYSFRGAEPQLFSDYRMKFPDHDSEDAKHSEAVTVFMSNNFRCDKNVIDFTNKVCGRLFSHCGDSIGYRADDDLIFSKSSVGLASGNSKVKIHVTLPPEETVENLDPSAPPPSSSEALRNREVRYIAKEIQRLITTEKKADGTPIRPCDIAVLYRSSHMAPLLSEALAELNIKATSDTSDKYFENPDVLLMLSLLNALDNPRRDVYLAGALRSFLFDFDLEDIITVQRHSPDALSLYDAICDFVTYCEESGNEYNGVAQKCRRFIETFERWRRASLTMSVDKLIRMLYDEDVFVTSGLVRDINDAEGGNFLRLYEYARSFSSGTFNGLYDFIEYINKIIERGQKLDTASDSSAPDKVNLMTIHHSKGLEYPVCFLCNASGEMILHEQKDNLLLDYTVGTAMKVSVAPFVRMNTPMREAIIAKKQHLQKEDEMRILYVALTRARERLYITATSKKTKEEFLNEAKGERNFSCRHSIISAKSYLDWILAYVSENEVSPVFDLELCDTVEVKAEDVPQELLPSAPSDSDLSLENNELGRSLAEKFSFKYPYSDLSKIPAKLSVSKLSPDVLDEEEVISIEDAQRIFKADSKAPVPEFFLKEKITSATPTERGTATHLFLQFCDFKALRERGVDEELGRLISKGFIPSSASELIYKDDLEAFAKGEFIEKIINAKRVIREQRFNLLLPASAFTLAPQKFPNIENEDLAIQGVIDLIIIDTDGSLRLYDYKTDRLTKAELGSDDEARAKMNDRHALQLSYYVKAVELLFGKAPDEISVFSTHASKLYPIDAKELVFISDKE